MLSQIGIFASASLHFPAYGTVLESACYYSEQYDAWGTLQSGYFVYWEKIADGFGGFFNSYSENTSGCYYPSGYAISYTIYDQNSFNWTNSFSGEVGVFSYKIDYNTTYADGSGGTVNVYPDHMWSAPFGYVINEYLDTTSGRMYYVAYDGDMGYFEDSYLI